MFRRDGCRPGTGREYRLQRGSGTAALAVRPDIASERCQYPIRVLGGKTLDIAQTLYERKYITYPRTGSRYIPDDVAREIPSLLGTLREHSVFGQEAAAVSGTELNRRSIDNRKVTDHHALLITGVVPTALSTEERTVYDLIAGRMVEAFGAVCVKDISVVRLKCAGLEFTARGTVIKSGGWRKVWQEPEERTMIRRRRCRH